MPAQLSETTHCQESMIQFETPHKHVTFLYCSVCDKYFTLDMREIHGLPNGNVSLGVLYDAVEDLLA